VFVAAAGADIAELPELLNQVMVPIIDREVCNQPDWYNGTLDDSMICAGYAQGGRDTCQVYARNTVEKSVSVRA